MTESTIVQTYVDLALSTPSATDEQLSSALQNAGISIDHAERAIAFVPMAFARVVLRGAAFPEEFIIRDPDTDLIAVAVSLRSEFSWPRWRLPRSSARLMIARCKLLDVAPK